MEKLKKNYKIDFDTVDVFGKLSINIISKYMQELASRHATMLGISFIDGEDIPEVYWILSRVKYNMQKYPTCNEEITIETYPAGCDKLFMIRYFEIKDKNGEIIGNIIANYLLMDAKRQRPIKINTNTGVFAKANYLYEGEKVSKVSKVTVPEREEIRKSYYSELDYNGHMNNSHYIRWCADMLTKELLEGREIKSIEMNYNAPIMCNDKVKLTLENKDGEYLVSGHNVLDNKNYFNTKIVLTDI